MIEELKNFKEDSESEKETGAKSHEEEFKTLRVLDKKGKEIGTVETPNVAGTIVFEISPRYPRQGEFSARDLMPYEKIVKLSGEWGYVDKRGNIRQLKNKEVKIGKIDSENKTITFE